MNIAQRIQAKTDNGDLIIDFLIEVMQGQPSTQHGDEHPDFRMCHRLDAARLLTKYGCSCKSAVVERDEAIDFIVDNAPEPSGLSTSSASSDDSTFDIALAKKIRQSTDDGATVCRFLINVMDGDLKAFKPHHRITAARELLSRGFGKHACTNSPAFTPAPAPSPVTPAPSPVIPAKAGIHGGGDDATHTSAPNSQPTKSHKSPNHTNHSSDNSSDPEEEERWAKIWEEINPILEEAERISAEQEPDPDNPPYVPDFSAADEAMDNSHRWFHEWRDSIDPEEYQAIISDTAARFDAKINLRIERRKQIAADRERREKEEAEREAEQAKARAEAKAKAESEPEEPDLGPPPSEEEHEYVSATPKIPGSYVYRKCGHPKCTVCNKPRYFPEDDRGSPYYFDGRPPTMYPRYPL